MSPWWWQPLISSTRRQRWSSSSTPTKLPSPFCLLQQFSTRLWFTPFSRFPIHLMQTMSFQKAIVTMNEHLCKTPPHNADNKSEQVRVAKFQTLFKYIETLGMEGPLSRLSVIHIAGTKGKGSTCAFTESILRSCGYRTALFTSPHLVDIRERFRFNGVMVSEEVFAKYFWWCWDRLQGAAGMNLPMPGFFPFLTLLALKMFTEENVDVAILEVGLGGRLDATNIVQNPVVCGIASLGYDHMEILGNTLAEIAGEKAGIFKAGVPAFSVPQKPEAMEVLEDKAKRLSVPLALAPPLESYHAENLSLGLEGDHQRVNAALAVALCLSWERRHGAKQNVALLDQGSLPEAYVYGLAATSWPGRGQIIRDKVSICNGAVENGGVLEFYLDGAHSPESMEACALWFSSAVSPNKQVFGLNGLVEGSASKITKLEETVPCQKVLLFNCMPKRDPEVLLQQLVRTCQNSGFYIDAGLFVPPFSSATSIDTRSVSAIYSDALETRPDLQWQMRLQNIWESLQHDLLKGRSIFKESLNTEEHAKWKQGFLQHQDCVLGAHSVVIPSLHAAVDLLRHVASSKLIRIQVLVTGSLYLVGDVLRILGEKQGLDAVL